jgi:hypothetical protein
VDPLSVAAISGVALTEGIKFLYGQAGELLRRRRERTSADQPATPPPAGVLDRDPGPLVPDPAVLGGLAGKLQDLRDDLEPYVLDHSRLESHQPLPQVAALRDALEAIYGHRLTFMGEPRESSGTVITGTARIKIVEGLAAGVRIDDLSDVDRVYGEIEADKVRPGGEAFGIDARRQHGTGPAGL